MLRERLIARSGPRHHEFQWRSREVSRLEGLSDTVFGFAITLLIVSLEVPRTSAELLNTMRGFLAFVLTFGVLFSLWHKQFIFFRRYGLEDTRTIVLNGALLLFVLFFVFPFKFLANAMVNRLLGLGKTVELPNGKVALAIQPEHWPMIFAIYGLGLAAIFAVFGLLYRHAYSAREELDLSEVEQYDTRETMRLYFANAGLGVVVGVNGLITGFRSETTLENALTLAFAAVELVVALFLVRFRATRKTRRARFLESLTAPLSTEQLPLHAN
jgi:uncharacterized membrane protein